jgi:hypothetical protein
MFGGIERSLATFQVEVLSADFMLRGRFKPLGEMAVYLNDRRRDFIRLDEVELIPLVTDRALRGAHRETMNVNKHALLAISLTVAEEAQSVQVLASKRPVVFYLGPLIVRGELHANVDALYEDLLDDARDFHPVSGATIFSVRNATVPFAREVPLLFVQRARVQGYHLHEG